VRSPPTTFLDEWEVLKRRAEWGVISARMIRSAFLGSQFVGQLRQASIDDVEVVWAGSNAERFAAEVPPLKPDVVVVDLSELETESDQAVTLLLDRCNAELAIITYSFARRQLIRALTSNSRVRALQLPVTLTTLRAHLAPMVIRRVLESTRREAPPMKHAEPKYDREQLGRLMEVASSVQCECPSNVAQVLAKVQAFEAYSKACESRNDKDREVHAALYEASHAARLKLEQALTTLLEHERITV